MTGTTDAPETTRIRWAFHSTDQAKTGTEDDVPTGDVAWLVQCGNVVVVGSDQDRALDALRAANTAARDGSSLDGPA